MRPEVWETIDIRLINRRLDRITNQILACLQKYESSTDYTARQYIGNLGKTENGIVSVNAYGVVEGITYPLMFKIFKPRACLQEGDKYKTKPEIAIEIIQELKDFGFKIKLVLADSLYGESGDVIGVLAKLKLQFINELG